jgi:hypothetical protein
MRPVPRRRGGESRSSVLEWLFLLPVLAVMCSCRNVWSSAYLRAALFSHEAFLLQ